MKTYAYQWQTLICDYSGGYSFLVGLKRLLKYTYKKSLVNKISKNRKNTFFRVF